MFIWTVGDAIGGIIIGGVVLAFIGALAYSYARYYWRKLFNRKVQ